MKEKNKVIGLKPVKVGKNTFMDKVLNALNALEKTQDPILKEVFLTLTDITDKHQTAIMEGHYKGSKTEPSNGGYVNDIYINYTYDLSIDKFGEVGTFADVVVHELKHAYDNIKGIRSQQNYPGKDFRYTEFSTVCFENLFRAENKRNPRTSYGGVPIKNNRNIPDLYKKAMLWKDWKNAPRDQR